LDGYFFTLVDIDQPWPSEGMVNHLAILARPAKLGETGSCWFYLNTKEEMYFSNYDLEAKVPPWPTNKHIQSQIWNPLPASMWKP
jgi:hypothetical protein